MLTILLVPELCLLDFKNRYADFYYPETGLLPKEEYPPSIFEATINPFGIGDSDLNIDSLFMAQPDLFHSTTMSAPRTTHVPPPIRPPPTQKIITTLKATLFPHGNPRRPFVDLDFDRRRPPETEYDPRGRRPSPEHRFEEPFRPQNDLQMIDIQSLPKKGAFPTLMPMSMEEFSEQLEFPIEGRHRPSFEGIFVCIVANMIKNRFLGKSSFFSNPSCLSLILRSVFSADSRRKGRLYLKVTVV